MNAEQIKQAVPMNKAVEFYGFNPNRSGYICCPFHREDTPSLKIYPDNRGWYCFGCNRGGDVIDFVRSLYNLDFPAACKKINDDFALGLNIDGKRDYYAERKARDKIRLQQIAKQEAEQWRQKMSNLLCNIHRKMWFAIKSGDTENPLFFPALQNIGQVNYYIDCLNGDADDFKKNYDREEVSRWANMTGLKI